MDPSLVDIVLVRPARPANVAAACRAMKNMGLRTLRIVGPPPGLERPEARALAYGAWDVLDAAIPAATLGAAVAASTLVAVTSARAGEGTWTPRRMAREAAQRAGGGRVSVVFGPEATGLTNDELALSPFRVHIPADPAHPSLNLAQAVLLLAYEIRLSAREPAPPAEAPRAAAGEIEGAVAALRAALLAIGYLSRDNPDAVLSEIRGLVVRSGPTPREVTLLRGVARQVLWAAGRIARSGGAEG